MTRFIVVAAAVGFMSVFTIISWKGDHSTSGSSSREEKIPDRYHNPLLRWLVDTCHGDNILCSVDQYLHRK